jgi:hypothetical protein
VSVTSPSLARWVVAAVSLLGLLGSSLVAPPRATAAVASDFSAGSLIADSVFYDFGTMTEAEIQAFLVQRGRSCVAGEMPCLKDYRENTPTRPQESGLCWGYTGAAGESAARIIRKVATACEINPRVLLVMLEKENSLLTRSRPTARSYQAAMGFGCPDTAPCNTEYYGFSNQVYRAARQFLVYRQNATRYGYQAGRTNTIRYNPDAACGSGPVFIENQATAALYIYTPYQPNAAALANLYGVGDRCSAYGNRNFWRLFTDWFGDPRLGSALVRTEQDPQVFLLADGRRLPVPDLAVYGDYVDPLGPVGYVSSALLSRYPLGPTLGRVVRDTSDGSLYWIARGAKHHFPSCDVVVRWSNRACGDAYVDLDPAQIAAFRDGPAVAAAVGTSSGRSYWVEGGRKREILDAESRAAAGIPGDQTTVPDTTVAALPLGTPVIRTDVMVTARGSSSAWLVMGSTKHAVADDVRTGTGLRTLPQGTLDTASLGALPTGAPIGLLVQDPVRGATALLTNDGLVPAPVGAPPGVPLSPGVSRALPTRAAVTAPYFLKSPTNPAVWAADTVGTAVHRRQVNSWSLLQAYAGTNPRVLTIAPSLLSSVPQRTGPWVAPGRLVKSSAGPEIYLVDGIASAVHVESFSDVAALGLSRSYATVDPSTLRTHDPTTRPLSPVVRCGTSVLAGVGGRISPRAVADPAIVPVSVLSPGTCSRLPAAGAATTGPLFVKGSGATVYVTEGSVIRPVRSWSSVLRLNAGHGAPLIVTFNDAALRRLPVGPAIS